VPTKPRGAVACKAICHQKKYCPWLIRPIAERRVGSLPGETSIATLAWIAKCSAVHVKMPFGAAASPSGSRDPQREIGPPDQFLPLAIPRGDLRAEKFHPRAKRWKKRGRERLDTKFNLPLQLRHQLRGLRDGMLVRSHLSGENRNVTKKEIVKSISEEIGLTQLKTKEIVQKTFDAIIETLVADHRIELRNFGVFEVKKRAARKARNPRTGERVDVAEKWVVTFKPGKEMEERVRQLEQEAADAAARAAANSAPTPEPAHQA
jgi:integration host factor subunit beta